MEDTADTAGFAGTDPRVVVIFGGRSEIGVELAGRLAAGAVIVLAARRAGIKTIILPKRNERDLEDIPPEVRNEMKFVFVETVDEVLTNALRDGATERTEEGAQTSPSQGTVLN